MTLTRFRIRTIMITIAVLAVLIVVGRMWIESTGVWHVSMDLDVLDVEYWYLAVTHSRISHFRMFTTCFGMPISH